MKRFVGAYNNIAESEDMRQIIVPDEILDNIPPYFIAAFAGELVSAVGLSTLDKDDFGEYNFNNYIGEDEWVEALYYTCFKTGVFCFADYYSSVLYENDGRIIDSIIGLWLGMFLDNKGSEGENKEYRDYIKERLHTEYIKHIEQKYKG